MEVTDVATAKPVPRMTVEEFLDWSEKRAGRYELYDGEVFTMQSERQIHNRTKLSVAIAFGNALAGKRSGCQTFTDGFTIRIDNDTAFGPDAVIDRGPCEDNSVLSTLPVVVVEIGSPSTSRIDETRKFVGYFSVPSVAHYLIIEAQKKLVIHHRRNGDEIVTRFLHANEGDERVLHLDPPNLKIDIAKLFFDPESG